MLNGLKCFFEQKPHFHEELLFNPYLCFAAVPGKKEEKTTKTVEQGKKKWRRLTLSSLERQQQEEDSPGLRQAEDNNLSICCSLSLSSHAFLCQGEGEAAIWVCSFVQLNFECKFRTGKLHSLLDYIRKNAEDCWE